MRPESGRPPLLLAAGLVLMLGGALYAADAIRQFASSRASAVSAVLAVLVGLGTIYAGVLVLRLREQGRVLGLALAAVGAAFAVLALIQGYVPAVVALLLNGFVIFALMRTQESFRRA